MWQRNRVSCSGGREINHFSSWLHCSTPSKNCWNLKRQWLSEADLAYSWGGATMKLWKVEESWSWTKREDVGFWWGVNWSSAKAPEERQSPGEKVCLRDLELAREEQEHLRNWDQRLGIDENRVHSPFTRASSFSLTFFLPQYCIPPGMSHHLKLYHPSPPVINWWLCVCSIKALLSFPYIEHQSP